MTAGDEPSRARAIHAREAVAAASALDSASCRGRSSAKRTMPVTPVRIIARAATPGSAAMAARKGSAWALASYSVPWCSTVPKRPCFTASSRTVAFFGDEVAQASVDAQVQHARQARADVLGGSCFQTPRP